MKIAVITGASSGMGREFVLQLAKEMPFDEIWVIARRLDRLESLQSLVPQVRIRPLAMDLTLPASLDEYKTLDRKSVV